VSEGGGVIVRTERRRRYSDAEKAAIVAESLRPDVTVVSVARRHGIAKSVIYNWRANRREAEAIAREALEFIPCGQFVTNQSLRSARWRKMSRLLRRPGNNEQARLPSSLRAVRA
jgi:transposase